MRIKETRVNATGTRTTWYQHPDNQGGLSFECDSGANTNCADPKTSNRHYLNAGGMTIGVLVSDGALPALPASASIPVSAATSIVLVKVEYWHKDQLGSLISTTNQLGAVTATYSYDPFGKRRLADGQYDPFGNLVYDWVTGAASGTDRGYTGHEHLDDIGVINMNGRFYDPMLGMFMQADPLMQNPGNLQNFNRYGYCYNNPLTCSDPSGQLFLIDDLIYALVAIAAARATNLIDTNTARSLIGIAVAFYLGPAGEFFGGPGSYGVGQAAVAGFTSGAISTGSFKGGLQGAFSSMLFFGAGDLIGGAFTDGFQLTGGEAIAVHAVAGCVGSVVGGGQCGPGALSAAFSKAATPFTGQQDPVIGTITSAAIGGTASVLGGGTFANGAMTAAYGYMFNELLHNGNRRDAMRRAGYEYDPRYVLDRIVANLRADFPGKYDEEYRLLQIPLGSSATGAASPLLRPLNVIVVNSDMFSSISANNIDDFTFMITHEASHLSSSFAQHLEDSWIPNNPAHDVLDSRAYSNSRSVLKQVSQELGFSPPAFR